MVGGDGPRQLRVRRVAAMVRIASRFPETRLKVAERARLNGIVRHLWTKLRLALDNAAPALQALREAGVDVLVLKGMALAALDMHNLKGRIAHDIDILVPPAKVAPALAILDGGGWRSTRGESACSSGSVVPPSAASTWSSRRSATSTSTPAPT